MQTLTSRHRIITLSRLLRHTILIVAIIHPVVVLLVLLGMQDSQLAHIAAGSAGPNLALTMIQRWLVIALGVLPALIISIGLLCLRPALHDMGAGRAFGARAFHGLRRLAAAIVISTISKLAATPLIGLVLSWHGPEKSLPFSLALGDIHMLILGTGIWLMAWIMAAGYDLATENAQFV